MEPYQDALAGLVRSASTGSDIQLLRLPSAIVEGKGFASAQALEVPAILRSIAGAVSRGCEALAIGNGFDPGLWEARELFNVPILGLFETAALYALRVGWRVGVLCSGRSGVSRIEEIVTRYGIEARFVRPVAAGISVPQIVAAFSDSDLASEVVAAAKRSIAELAIRGAEVVIVASGALDVFLHTRPTELAAELPVVPSVMVLIRELETAAGIARLGIPATSRAGRFAQPPRSVLEAIQPAT